MIKKNRPTIYSQFEIDALLFYMTMLLFMPVVLVFTYLFQVDEILNVNTFMFWLLIVNFILIIVGTIGLIIKKDVLKRRVKPVYRIEFFYLLFLYSFGLLGFVVIYDYMGGNRAYIANILVVLFAGLLFLVIYLGRKFFKFDYMRKK
ncbi:MAG TPA: hypothetical protein PK113_03635 [Bacillota bacterium]|nr:hypothetical protein [Bacillota bacterium]